GTGEVGGRGLGLAAAGRGLGDQQRRSGGRRRRVDRHRLPHGPLAVGALRRLVLTHAHIDHVGGTKAFPLASILATPATSALLDQPLMTDGYKAFMPA